MSFRSTLSLAAVLGAVALQAAPALAEGDPTAGAAVFRQCQACHVANAEQNRVGPNLVKIINRPMGEVENFKYSPAYLEHKAAGDVWSVENLTDYLANPRAYMPGTRMAFAGLKNPQQIADVIAYLQVEAGVWGE